MLGLPPEKQIVWEGGERSSGEVLSVFRSRSFTEFHLFIFKNESKFS